MAARVEWSPEALRDVEGIAEYIARDSPRYASVLVDRIVAATRRIGEFPKAGRITPELGIESIRERSVSSYRVIYRLRDNVATIAAVIHGKRLLGDVEHRLEN